MGTNRTYSLMFFLLWMTIGVNAQEVNNLYIPDMNVFVGRQFQLPVYIENTSQKITGLQFTIMVPEGIVPDFENVSLTERSADHQVQVHQDNSTQWTLLLFSSRNTVITGNEGVVLNIPARVTNAVEEGNLKGLTLQRVVLSDNLGNNVLTEFTCGNVNIMKTPDFTVTDVVSSLTTIKPEDTFSITWKVRNIGAVPSNGGWHERVSLISESGDSIELGSLYYGSSLDADAEMQRSMDVELGRVIGIDGKANILVELIPDENSGEIESKYANNKAESEQNGITILNKLYITLPSQVIEPVKDSTLVLSVVRSGSSKNALNVTLSKTGDERLVLPENIVIPVSNSEAVVNLTLKSDNLQNEEQTFIIKMEAEGYQTVSQTLTVLDDDGLFPNLHVTEVVCSEPIAGKLVEISWKVKNDGYADTGDAQWKDYVWLIPEISGGTSMEGSVLLGSYDNQSALEPGESYETKVSITMPEKKYGNYDLVVMSDMTSLDNIDFSATGGEPPYPYEPATSEYGYLKGKTTANSVKVREAGEANGISDNFFYLHLDIQVPPLPDIAVTKVVATVDTSVDEIPSPLSMAGLAASSAFYSGKKVILTVTVKNQGEADVADTNVTNCVYISHSEDKDAEGVRILNWESSKLSLTKGESQTIILTCQIPYEWSGDTWFHVQIDKGEAVDELANTENNWGHSDMSYVLLTPGADFKVSSLKVPAIVNSGQSFNISYTVNNIGPGVPYTSPWTDKVYLSASPDGIDESAILLKTYSQGGSYQATTIGNIVPSSIPLDAYHYYGDDYSYTRTITAPVLASGKYYIYLVVDADDVVYEFEGEDNNIAISSPIECIVSELTSELVSIGSENLMLGGSSIFSWKIKNSGQGSIQKATVTNSFYASSSEDGADPCLLDNIESTISIASGGELSMKGIVKIPNENELLGNKYVFMVTNTEKTIAESNYDNNQSNTLTKIFEPSANLIITDVSFPASMTMGETATVKISLKNMSNFPISGDATVLATLSVPDSDDNVTLQVNNPTLSVNGLGAGSSKDVEITVTIPNNLKGGDRYIEIMVIPSDQSSEGSKPCKSHSEVYINGYLPDLTISSYDVPENILTATPTPISWTVSNIGEWDSQGSTYKIWLKDNVDDSDAVLLMTGDLPSISKGGTTTANDIITIDDSRYGEKYLNIEIIENDEEKPEDNNSISIPVAVAQSELPDLVISNITVDGVLRNGETVTITARVTNRGIGTTRTEKWTDAFYLSTESEFNKEQAMELGSKVHVGSLALDDSYDITMQLNIPLDVHGNYYLHGVTDATDVNLEAGKENNIDEQKVYVEDKSATPAQLVVNSVSAPSNIFAGETFTLSYQVTNNSEFAANGTLRDIIYLSKDSKWDQDDEMVGVVSGSVDIAANTVLTRQINGRILNITEGNYYLIVKTNTTRNIIETDYTDNIAVTSHPVKISFATLSPGSISSVHTSGYYKMEVSGSTEGKTLGFSLSHNEDEPCGIYVSYERVPSTAKYDWSSAAVLVNEQEVLVPKVKDGTYYILAQANSAAGLNTNQFILSGEDQQIPEVNMTLSVKDVPFGATSLSVKEGGTGGWVSTEIRGALLDSIMDFRLVREGEMIPAESITFYNQTSSKASFNLNDAETGNYNVVSELPDGTLATMSDGFRVVPGKNVALGVKLEGPKKTRVSGYGPVSVTYVNGGNTDIVIRELLLTIKGGQLGTTIEELKKNPQTELHIRPDTKLDNRGYVVIPPGKQETVNCYFYQTSGYTYLYLYIVK